MYFIQFFWDVTLCIWFVVRAQCAVMSLCGPKISHHSLYTMGNGSHSRG